MAVSSFSWVLPANCGKRQLPRSQHHVGLNWRSIASRRTGICWIEKTPGGRSSRCLTRAPCLSGRMALWSGVALCRSILSGSSRRYSRPSSVVLRQINRFDSPSGRRGRHRHCLSRAKPINLASYDPDLTRGQCAPQGRAEDPARVVRLGELAKISSTRIELGEVAVGAKDCRPMGAWLKWLQRGLDLLDERGNGRRVGPPGEMDPEDAPLVRRAEPEFVGDDRTDLGTFHERRDSGSKPAEGVAC